MMLPFILSVGVSAMLFTTPTHDMPLALFTWRIDDRHHQLDMTFDRDDLLSAIGEVEAGSLSEYLAQHTAWEMGDYAITWTVVSVSTTADHYLVQAEAFVPHQHRASLRIRNSCLLAERERHSNIIHVVHAGKTRSFRLNKSRISTQLEL